MFETQHNKSFTHATEPDQQANLVNLYNAKEPWNYKVFTSKLGTGGAGSQQSKRQKLTQMLLNRQDMNNEYLYRQQQYLQYQQQYQQQPFFD